jgi:hypothetical protein
MNQTDLLSNNGLTRIDILKARADADFNYEWLYELLWEAFRKDAAKMSRQDFCDNLHDQNKEKQFVWLFVESHRQSLPEIKEMHDNLFDDEDFGVCLLNERNQLIEEFGSMHLSTKWDHVYRDKEGKSWRRFAQNLHFDRPEEVTKIRRFLYLLDKISIITDLLCKRDKGYGMKVNLVKYKRARINADKGSKENEPPRQHLIQAIVACKDMFWGQTAWAVVYVLCREDYGIADNKSLFERYVQDLLKEPELKEMDKGCPSGTIQSAETGKDGSGAFYQKPSSSWTICGAPARAIELMSALRQKLKDLETEAKEKELKELYKLSEKGF